MRENVEVVFKNVEELFQASQFFNIDITGDIEMEEGEDDKVMSIIISGNEPDDYIGYEEEYDEDDEGPVGPVGVGKGRRT